MTDTAKREPWLPRSFVHPTRVELAAAAHLRPIRGADTDIDYPAVMGSRERLGEMYGDIWGWPPATMTFEADRLDLERHIRARRADLSDGEPVAAGPTLKERPSFPLTASGVSLA